MKNLEKFLMLLFLGSFWALPTYAITYYVANNGDDSRTKTEAQNSSTPWCTIAKVNSMSFNPGDSILFRRGDTWRETLIPSSGGNSGNPITYGAYGTGKQPIITGADYISGSWTQYSGNIYSLSKSLWVDRGGWSWVFYGNTKLSKGSSPGSLSSNQYYFDFNGDPGIGGTLLSGILYVNIGKAPNSTDINAAVRQRGAYINKSYLNFIRLHFCKTKNGIGQWAAQSNYVFIRECTFDYSRMGMYTGANESSNADYWTIENNTFINIGHENLDHAIYTKWATGWIIQNNTIKNACLAIDLNGSSNAIVRYNYSEGNSGGFLEFYEDNAGSSSYNKVYYNISNGDRKLIYTGGSSNHTGNKVYNNTCYNFTYAGLDIEDGADIAVVKNNIFYSTVSGSHAYVTHPGSLILNSSNNLLLAPGYIDYNGSGYSDLKAFRAAYPSLEVNSIDANPQFVGDESDFHLHPLSPCIDAGVDVSLTQDFEGNAVPFGNNLDIGAYENVKTSIKEKSLANTEIMVCPNPTNGQLTISGMEGMAKLEVYTLSGAKVYQATGDIILPYSIDISDYHPGIYIVKVTADGNSFMRKVMKE